MITFKLTIYSLILFILFVKIPSCNNSIFDLINIVLIILLFNLILEKVINNNLQENYEPISNNLYSSVEMVDQENSDTKSIEESNEESNEKLNEKSNKKSNEKSNQEYDKKNIQKSTEQSAKSNNESTKASDEINLKSDNKKQNIDDKTEKQNNIVNVIKDNVVNIFKNNFSEKVKERDEVKLDNKFIYGYSYLHTDNWSIPEKRVPVCKNIKPCKICPNKTNGFNPDLLNYNNIYNEKK